MTLTMVDPRGGGAQVVFDIRAICANPANASSAFAKTSASNAFREYLHANITSAPSIAASGSLSDLVRAFRMIG
jgi:hypothetical protein